MLLVTAPKNEKKTMKHQIKMSSSSGNKESGKTKQVTITSDDGKKVAF